MTRDTIHSNGVLLASSILLACAGSAAAADVTLTIESWRNDDLRHLAGQDHPGLRGAEPRHQGRVRADRRRPNTTRRSTPSSTAGSRRRPHHLPAVRRVARALQQGPARRPQRPAGHGELLRRRQVRLDHRRRQGDLLRADGLGHPRLHLQQGRLRQARHRRADDRGRVLRRARQDQGRRHLHPAGHGHQGPVGSRDHGLPEHRPELLEGRGRPPGADQGRRRS